MIPKYPFNIRMKYSELISFSTCWLSEDSVFSVSHWQCQNAMILMSEQPAKPIKLDLKEDTA